MTPEDRVKAQGPAQGPTAGAGGVLLVCLRLCGGYIGRDQGARLLELPAIIIFIPLLMSVPLLLLRASLLHVPGAAEEGRGRHAAPGAGRARGVAYPAPII